MRSSPKSKSGKGRPHSRAEFSVDLSDLNRVLEHAVALDVRALTTSPPTLEELLLRHDQDTPIDDREAELKVVRGTP